MVKSLIPQHIFISYSHHDDEYATKIIETLKSAGIVCWIDRKNVMAGTPNWEVMIRDAIRLSFAVLLLASPYSGQSDIIRGELRVARNLGCPIYPLWIAGSEWIDCVPLDMIQAQYVDCRESQYTTGLSLITKTLKMLINERLPRHFLMTNDEYRQYLRWNNGNFDYGDYLFIDIYRDENRFVALRTSS